MHHLFALFDEIEMKDNVNYYFALDQQITEMENYEKMSRKATKEKVANRSIISEEDEIIENKEEEKLSPIM
jgi:hypothetical protein